MNLAVESNKVQVKHILKVDPFGQDYIIYDNNSNNIRKLVEDVNDFFSHIYENAQGGIIVNNNKLNYNIDEWLAHNNNFEYERNCLLFFIEGYAGCGKSTLVQHILYTCLNNQKYEYSYYNYDIGNYPDDYCDVNNEGKDFIKSSILRGLKNQIFTIIQEKNSKAFFEKFELLMSDEDLIKTLDGNAEIGINFGSSQAFLTALSEVYNVDNNKGNIKILKLTIETQLRDFDTYQLLCIDYLWRLAQYFVDPQMYRKYMYVCYDNLDSVMNYEILSRFKDQLRCFRSNLSAYILKLKQKIKYHKELYGVDEVHSFVIFTTYRKITAIRSNNIHNEMLNDMVDEDYVKYIEVSKQYNFNKIADKRIKHFKRKLNCTNICKNKSDLIKQMKSVKDLQKMVFVKNIYSRLWNNNLRSCSNVLNELIIHNNYEIRECIKLYSNDNFDGHIPDRNCYYGASSLFLHAVCKLLKNIGIFDENCLDLINIKEDAQKKYTSLSRLLITYIYTENRSIPISELFKNFERVFEAKYICKIVGQLLTRQKGEIWRRPIYYSKHAPYNETNIADKLYEQYLKYKQQDEAYEYVEFKICDCGKTYIDAIVPHFEFYSIRINENNKSVYCIDELEDLEMILESVYEKIEVCCKKQKEFSEKYIKEYSLSKNKYLEQAFHPRTRKGNPQLHIERVIFSHIAYLNNFRWYLSKHRQEKYSEFNCTLVNYIEKYLNLYEIYIKQISDVRKNIAKTMSEKVKLAIQNKEFVSIEADTI